MGLVIEKLHSGYGNLEILKGIDLQVPDGSITGLIGPNGAGKSTVLKAIFGYLWVSSGKVFLDKNEITNVRTYEILKKGISYVAQKEGLFPNMTVWENLRLGGYLIKNKSELNERIDAVLSISGLSDRINQKAGSLSGGERRILEIGRGLMLSPKLVLLDEPSAALSPKLVNFVYDHLQKINEYEKTTFMIVEQDVNLVLEKAHYIYALQLGQVIHSGRPEEFKEDEKLRTLFLGKRVK